MSGSLQLHALWGTGAMVLYLCALRLLRKRVERRRWAPDRRYRIYRRDDVDVAHADGPLRGVIVGALLCVLSYLAAPVLLWRYGLRAAILITLAPLALALTMTLTLGAGEDPATALGVPMLARAVVAVLIARCDGQLRDRLLRRHGHRQIATAWASSGKRALAGFARHRWDARPPASGAPG